MGYRFHFGENRESSISIRFNFYRIPEYLARSDRLFFDILNWIAHNKKVLDNVVNDDIEIGIGPERNANIIEGRVGISELEGNDRNKINNINKKIFEYKNYNELTQNIYKIIELYFNFSSVPVVNNSFRLYFVWEQDPNILGYGEGVHKQEESTEIFFGPFPGLMFNSPGLREGVVFWELKKAKNYLLFYSDENYSLEYKIINRNNIYSIFEELS
jgi:hypothetical protein